MQVFITSIFHLSKCSRVLRVELQLELREPKYCNAQNVGLQRCWREKDILKTKTLIIRTVAGWRIVGRKRRRIGGEIPKREMFRRRDLSKKEETCQKHHTAINSVAPTTPTCLGLFDFFWQQSLWAPVWHSARQSLWPVTVLSAKKKPHTHCNDWKSCKYSQYSYQSLVVFGSSLCVHTGRCFPRTTPEPLSRLALTSGRPAGLPHIKLNAQRFSTEERQSSGESAKSQTHLGTFPKGRKKPASCATPCAFI